MTCGLCVVYLWVWIVFAPCPSLGIGEVDAFVCWTERGGRFGWWVGCGLVERICFGDGSLLKFNSSFTNSYKPVLRIREPFVHFLDV